jgi:hypothetical protein
MPSCDRALHALRSWLDSRRGIGHVAVGMARQGYDLQLSRASLQMGQTMSASFTISAYSSPTVDATRCFICDRLGGANLAYTT